MHYLFFLSPDSIKNIDNNLPEGFMTDTSPASISSAHNRGANFLFCNGHVKMAER